MLDCDVISEMIYRRGIWFECSLTCKVLWLLSGGVMVRILNFQCRVMYLTPGHSRMCHCYEAT